jgi:hypothetical protein
MGSIVKLIVIAAAVCLCPGISFGRGVVINAVGDVMLAGSGAPVYSERGYGYPFAATASDVIAGR